MHGPSRAFPPWLRCSADSSQPPGPLLASSSISPSLSDYHSRPPPGVVMGWVSRGGLCFTLPSYACRWGVLEQRKSRRSVCPGLWHLGTGQSGHPWTGWQHPGPYGEQFSGGFLPTSCRQGACSLLVVVGEVSHLLQAGMLEFGKGRLSSPYPAGILFLFCMGHPTNVVADSVSITPCLILYVINA